MAVMEPAPSVFEGGFEAPVFDAQAAFRALMDAMARPGQAQPIAARATAPQPLGSVAAALALTLCDADTPVWLDSAMTGDGEVAQWLGFHTGAPMTTDPGEAAFAFVADPSALGALDRFAHGTQEYPDRSTTLIVQVDSLTDGPPLTLSGPGIKDRASIASTDLPDRFAALWTANRALFPRGVDLVLAASDSLVGLPRTTQIESGGA